MKMFQVTDHATGEVENIEAESASIAGLAFQLEGRSVTIIPINPINDNPEVIMKDHEITKNNPKEEVKMEWKDKYLDIGYMSGRYRARRQAYNEKERYTKMWQRKEHLYVSQCKLCKSFTAWNKVTRQIHLLTKDQYGYWYNEKDMHVYGKCVEVVTQAVINPPQNVNAFELAVKQTTINPEEGNNMDINLITTTTNPKEGNKMATKPTYHIAFTGHRPDKIGGYDETSPKRFALRQEIQATLQRAVDKYSTTHQIIVISGGALGVDQDAARIAYQMNIPFIVAQPCKNHESKWFKESQIKYAKMLELAHEVVLVSDGTYDELGAKCMQDRNIWMVDHCDALIAVWDGTSGGTANCVKYALKVNKPIVYINPNNFGGEGGEPTSTPINPKEGPNMNVNPEPITKEVIIMDTKPVNKTTNPEEGTTMNKQTVPPAGALVKLEKLSPQETEWIINKLEENILPHLVADVSNYAKGRMRTWLPYEAPLDSPNSANRPFLPALLDDEVWQWIVDLCAKHGFKAETALISKGGNIKPHRDTTYAAAWAVGINLGSCNWHIASSRDMSTPDYTMDLDGGEIFKFNSKHTHAVTNADTDRWGINVWAIADTNAAQNADVRGRLETMLVDHPEVAEFIDYHQPGASKPIIKEVNTMESNATEAEWENNPNALGWMAVQDELVVDILPNLDNTVIVYHDEDLFWQCSVEEYKQMYTAGIRFAVCEKMGEMYRLVEMYRVADNEPGFMLTKFQWDSLPQLIKDYHDENKEENPEIVTTTTKEVIKMDTKPVNTTNNPEEGPKMKAEQPQNNNPVTETNNGKETKMSSKPISVDKWTTDMGLSVELKRSDGDYQKEAGRSWFAVVEGKVSYPKKDDGVIDELTARIWLSRNGLCAMPEIKTPEVKPTEKKEETMKVMNNPLIGAVTLPNGITLNLEQSQAYEAIVNGTGNMLLTGNAGTGKSFVLNQAIETMKQHGRSIVVTATTGIAATHINGKTYHSALRMFPNKPVDELVGIMSNQRFIRGMRSVELIVIDEISMMHKDDFVKLDLAFRQIFDSTKPFGGKRFCFVGDFLQIEPVDKENKAQTNFVFMTETWKNTGVVTHQLKQVVRQQDALFAGFLNNVRQGIWTSDMQPIVDAAMSKPKPKSGVVSLVPTNREADSINHRQMAALDTQEFVFEAYDRNPNKFDPVAKAWVEDKAYWDKNVLVEKTLKLKVGTQVICLLNHDGLVNGDTGVVEQIDDTTQAVQVNFNRVGLKSVVPVKFHQGQKEIEFRLQIPLKTAWAITIHKSQGMTLDSAIISAGAIFTDGQCYVCLSRVRSMDGLYLESFSPDIVSASDKALEFYGLPGNLRGPAAELHSNMPKGDDDPDGNGGVFPVDPTPNNNDGDDNAAVPTHEEEIMDEEVWEPKDPENFDFEDEEEEKEQVMEVTEPIKEQNFAKVDKSADATNKTPKEGINMIKEYLVHTPSLIDSSTIDKEMVHSRIITNDPKYAFGDGKSVVIEETKPGGYHWFFLEHMFGNQSFAVNITAYAEPILGEQQLGALAGDKKPEDVIFGWADFDAEYMIRVKGYKGTKFSDLSEYDLSVRNSAKMTKRLTEIIRSSRGGMVNVKGKHKMARILVLSHYDILDIFPHLKTEEIAGIGFDGASLITTDYAKKVYRANKHLSGKAKHHTLQDMDDRKMTNHTIRVVTNINGKPGMIKGNALSVPADAMLARLREYGMISSTQVVDIVTTVDNFKEELGTNGSWEIITLEPHHGVGMVKTNDQLFAQFKGIEGIFEYKHLLENFKSVLDNAYNNLVEGKDIEWMKNIVAERVTNEAGKFAAITGGKVTSNMNKMIASLNELGLDIGVSQTLMFMRAQGIKKMFLSETKKEGFNWQANAREKKSFVFRPYAYRAYVMSKEVLWLAGYDIDLDNKECFYHKETQTFCIPALTWAEIKDKLGGADFDDEIEIAENKYVRLDGTVNPLAAFVTRTPNDWAEFAILNLAEPGPAFLTDGDMPTIYAKDLAKFKQTSVTGKLPSATIGSDRPASAVWDWESSVYNYNASMYKNGGVGGQVKTKMLQYGINNAPFRNLPCANEDMIDALQQCKGTTADLKALVEWSVEATKQVLQSQSMDAYWWYSRNMFKTAKALKKNHGLTWWNKPLSDKQSPIVQEFMIPREEMVRETHQEMINFLNRNIMEIPELENIFDDKKQEMHYRKLINDLSKLFIVPKVRDEHGNVLSASKHEITRHMQAVSIGLLERMANYQVRAGIEQTNLHVLRMVRASYLVKQNNPGANYDRWLYTAANDSEVIMTDYFVRALIAFRG